MNLIIRHPSTTGTPKQTMVVAAESDSVASVIHKVIVKEQLEFAVPEMYRLVRCGNQSVTRDGSEPVRATLPRSGVVDVLTRTVEDYAIVEGDILAMQDASGFKMDALRGTQIHPLR